MYSAAIIRIRQTAFLLFFVCGLMIGFAPAASAEDTIVRTKVCNASTGSSASLLITSPATDSVVTTSPVTLAGNVQDVSQIDIKLDGVYSQTVALNAGATTFSLPLSLDPGTHTIEVTGVDICNFDDPTDSVVVTYQPNTTPSSGSQTPTTTPGVGKPGATGKPSGEGVADSPDWIDGVPLVPQAIALFGSLGRVLDFDEVAKDGVAKAVTRVAFFTLGIGLLLMGPLLLNRLARRERVKESVVQYVGNKSGEGKGVTHTHRRSMITRGGGLLLVLLTFVI